MAAPVADNSAAGVDVPLAPIKLLDVKTPLAVNVLEALKGPATLRLAATEDEAVKISPARLVMVGLNVPETLKLPTTVEEAAVSRNPPVKVASPVAAIVSVFTPPITVDEAVEIKPARVDSPETAAVPETVSVPPVLILVLMVDE